MEAYVIHIRDGSKFIGPGPSTWGEDLFSPKIRGRRDFFREKGDEGTKTIFRHIYLKTRPRYPAIFDPAGSLSCWQLFCYIFLALFFQSIFLANLSMK